MRRILFLFVCVLMTSLSFAQVKLGFKAGIGTTDLNADDLNILNADGREQFTLALKDANLGIYGGLLVQIRIGNFLIQPEVLYNSNSADFQLTDVDSAGLFNRVTEEKFQYLDVPVLFGVKVGPLRLMAGPEAHVFLSNTSGLLDVEGYREDFKDLTLGWQGGIGLDIWKIALDFRYQGNFTNYGDHLRFNGRNYNFNDEPARLLFSVAYMFGDTSE